MVYLNTVIKRFHFNISCLLNCEYKTFIPEMSLVWFSFVEKIYRLGENIYIHQKCKVCA